MAQNNPNDSQLILDQRIISKLNSELGSERMHEVITVFFQESPVRMQRIRTAAEQGNLNHLHRLTHAFLPICSMLGLNRLYTQIKMLADDCQHREARDTITCLSIIEQEYTRAIEALHQLNSQTNQDAT